MTRLGIVTSIMEKVFTEKFLGGVELWNGALNRNWGLVLGQWLGGEQELRLVSGKWAVL